QVHQVNGRSRAGAKRQRRPVARATGDRSDVSEERRLHGHRRCFTTRQRNVVALQRYELERVDRADVEAAMMPLQDRFFFVRGAVGVIELDLDEETIELGLRQWIRALELDRVL